MNKYLLVLAGGIGVGILGSFFYFNTYLSDSFVSHIEFEDNLKAYISSQETVSPTPSPDSWQSIVVDASRNTVAIETFSSNNRTIAKGNGIAVSSDGLIMTTADITRPAYVYQITFEGKVLKGTVVYRNIAKNISFLKVDETALGAAAFAKDYEYKTGTDVILTGKTVELSKTVNFSQRALINYVLDRSIVLDTKPDAMLNGSKVINSQNQLVGMAHIRNNKVYLISSDVIEEAIAEHLAQGN
jgi:hypothetical protein